MPGLTRRTVVGGAALTGSLLGAAGTGWAATPPALLFTEVLLVDGTGAAPRMADVVIENGRIARIRPPSARRTGFAGRTIKGDGRVLAPGFIDLHTHGDPLDQSYEAFLAMGVTTIALGQDGGGPRLAGNLDLAPWMAAVDRTALDTNVAAFSSHGTVRRAAGISDSVKRPDDAALARMTGKLDAELRAGAFGLSYGLEYVPGIYSEGPELAALGRTVSRHGRVVMSHMRTENDEDIEQAIDELIASSLPARPHISHLKVVFGKGEERARVLLEYLAAKRRQGIELSADLYPYNASFTGIAILFPEWALPPTDYAAIVAQRGPELKAYLERRMTRRGGPEALLIGTAPYAGKTVAQAAQEAGLPYVDFLVKVGPEGGSGAHFTMDEALQDRLLLDPFAALSTDGGPGMRHPRATGTYAKLIEDYVVKRAKLPIEEAVRKATSYPARILRIPDRGAIRVGAAADLVVFDPKRVRARSTFVDPFPKAEGFDLVVVNGEPAYEAGERVGRPGRLLRA